jgi:pimeloyl-ACP methyl ester carboxylesterase
MAGSLKPHNLTRVLRRMVPGGTQLLLAVGIGLGSCSMVHAVRAQTPPQAATATALSSAFDGARFSYVTGFGGVPLNVVEVGDRSLPAILLIHGFGQSYLSWTYQFGSDLKKSCHIVAFDLRGHGDSGSPWQASAYDTGRPWADDVNAVINATGIKDPLVVGWSYGGNVAMDFARYHPNVPIAGYVLVSTTGGFIKVPAPSANAPVRPTASPNLLLNIAGVDASTDFLFPPTVDPKLRDEFKAAAMRVSPFVYRAIVRRAGYDNLDLVSALQTHVTFVFGGKDPIVNPTLAHVLESRLPRAKTVVFPDAGHGLFIEDPERFNALLDADQCQPHQH